MRAARTMPLGPLIVGLGGFCILIALGIWQYGKVQWKNAIIAEAEERLVAPPRALPTDLDPGRDDYTRVSVTGEFLNAEESYFLTSIPLRGPGFNVIAPFETQDGRRILIDRGFVPQAQRDPSERPETRIDGETTVTGVLRWPRDTSSWTLDADLPKREFYSREVVKLAEFMDTEPVLVVAAPSDGPGYPRGSAAQVNIRNQHLPYAIQWFAIAAVWALMSFFWLRHARRQGEGL